MSGTIIGGVTGALTSGINIANGAVKIVASAQKTGTFFHGMTSNIQARQISLGNYKKQQANSKFVKIGYLRVPIFIAFETFWFGELDEARVEPKDWNMWRYFGVFMADRSLYPHKKPYVCSYKSNVKKYQILF